MKLMKTYLTLILVSGCGFAQHPVITKTRESMKGVENTKNAQIQQATAPQSKSAAPASQPKAAVATQPKPTAVVKQQKVPVATAPAVTTTSQVANATAVKPAALAKGRDPFVSPIVQKVTSSVSCTGGKKCLEPGQVTLKGVVSSDNGKIAVVLNPANKAYFLREKDPVLNGYVVRITSDSIVFRENVTDRLGKVSTKEVVKRVSAPAV